MPERGNEPHFFLEPSVSCGHRIFSRSRVTAAGITPQPCGMILPICAFLEHKLPFAIKDEHRNSAVQDALLVGFELFTRAYFPVVLVYMNELFVCWMHEARTVADDILVRKSPLSGTLSKCAREDLNLHAREGTATSRLRVCQFHHSRTLLRFVKLNRLMTCLLYPTSSLFSSISSARKRIVLSNTSF